VPSTPKPHRNQGESIEKHLQTCARRHTLYLESLPTRFDGSTPLVTMFQTFLAHSELPHLLVGEVHVGIGTPWGFSAGTAERQPRGECLR